MNKHLLALALSSLCCTAAYAQAKDTTGVTTSTDPAKAAQVEQHAQQLRDEQAKKDAAKADAKAKGKSTQTKSGSSQKSQHAKKPAAKASAPKT
jgi:hypothetical protein